MVDTERTQRPMVLAGVMLSMFMVAIEATIVATAMPEIVGKLGGFALYSWVFSAFLLTQAATTVIFGKLSDLYGRRPILVAGTVVFLLGSTLCGFATSMPMLILFRLLQGLGAGAIQPVTMTIIGDLYTAEERASIQGYLSSVWGVSAVIGPLIGGLIVERFSWQWVFWINLPIGVATVVMMTRFLHENVNRKQHSIDYAGTTLFFVGISALLLALTELGDAHGSNLITAVCLAVFVATIPLFLWQERRTKEPMMDLSLWSGRLIASSNGASVLAGMTLIGITGYLAVYVQGVMGRSATVGGLTLTMMAVGWPVASTLSRWFFQQFGMPRTLRIGCILIVLGSAMFLFMTPSSNVILPGAGSLITGFGMGLMTMTCVLLIQGSVDWSKRGSATASNVFSRTLGNTLGAAVLGSALNLGVRAYSDPAGRHASAEQMRALLEHRETGAAQNHALLVAALDHGLHIAYWLVFFFSLATFALALLIPRLNLADLGTQQPAEAAGH